DNLLTIGNITIKAGSALIVLSTLWLSPPGSSDPPADTATAFTRAIATPSGTSRPLAPSPAQRIQRPPGGSPPLAAAVAPLSGQTEHAGMAGPTQKLAQHSRTEGPGGFRPSLRPCRDSVRRFSRDIREWAPRISMGCRLLSPRQWPCLLSRR